jgi:site-specific DNA-methyltransferase (adenine-specific)
MIKLYKGDCLIESDKIESGSVDLILTDLPYGTVKGLGNSRVAKEKNYNVSEWDVTIDTKNIFEIANRILRKNGKMVLTANQPFTTELISKAIPNLPHCYNMYWDKMHFANCLVANKAPVSYIEDVLVFSKTHAETNEHPLAYYVRELQEKNNVFWNKEIANYYYDKGHSKSFNNAKAVLKHSLNWDYVQFSLFTKQHYERLKYFFDFDKTFEELKEIDNEFKKRFASTFNLWEGKKYKSNILKYKKDYDGYHPTQKPILLLEDLIKTFSNENDLVVDFTMGSGSTMVACQNTNRNGIGIEQDDKYFEIAKKRINQNEYKLF